MQKTEILLKRDFDIKKKDSWKKIIDREELKK